MYKSRALPQENLSAFPSLQTFLQKQHPFKNLNFGVWSAELHYKRSFFWRLTDVSCQCSLNSSFDALLVGVTVSRAVPEGLTYTTTLLCRVWTPSSLYWGRICVTLHVGSQIFQPGAALMTNPLGPPISCLFSTAMASRFFDRGLSHTSKLSTCRTGEM